MFNSIHTWWTAVVDCDENRSSDGRPDVADRQTYTGQRQEVEVAIKLLDVSRSVDKSALVDRSSLQLRRFLRADLVRGALV